MELSHWEKKQAIFDCLVGVALYLSLLIIVHPGLLFILFGIVSCFVAMLVSLRWAQRVKRLFRSISYEQLSLLPSDSVLRILDQRRKGALFVLGFLLPTGLIMFSLTVWEGDLPISFNYYSAKDILFYRYVYYLAALPGIICIASAILRIGLRKLTTMKGLRPYLFIILNHAVLAFILYRIDILLRELSTNEVFGIDFQIRDDAIMVNGIGGFGVFLTGLYLDQMVKRKMPQSLLR